MELRCSWCRWSQWDRLAKLRCMRGLPFVHDGSAHWCAMYQDEPSETGQYGRVDDTAAEYPVPLWLVWNLLPDESRQVLWGLAGFDDGLPLYTKPWGYMSLRERRAIRNTFEKAFEQPVEKPPKFVPGGGASAFERPPKPPKFKPGGGAGGAQ